ncbi:MAG: PqqD family protein [Desulfobacteraceae bacterium]|jgi:hypothetical protein|nr:PqqD family protein [Desulfobacteraceae bacterium]
MKVFKRRKTAETDAARAASLACRPTKNPEVQESPLDSGELLLVYPVRVRPWFGSLARRLGAPAAEVQTRRLQLDTLGTAAWRLLDGRRTVAGVVRAFAHEFQLHPREAEVSVTRFLKELGKRGLIGLKAPPGELKGLGKK